MSNSNAWRARDERKLRLAFCICLLLALAIAVAPWVKKFLVPDSDPPAGVILKLWPEKQVIRLGESPRVEVYIVNFGQHPVTLAEPANGWNSKTEPARLDWTCPVRHRGTCCVFLGRDEFTLQPGEFRRINRYSNQLPFLGATGRHQVMARYTNEPNGRVYHGPQDKLFPSAGVKPMRSNSDRIWLLSKPIEIEVVD